VTGTSFSWLVSSDPLLSGSLLLFQILGIHLFHFWLKTTLVKLGILVVLSSRDQSRRLVMLYRICDRSILLPCTNPGILCWQTDIFPHLNMASRCCTWLVALCCQQLWPCGTSLLGFQFWGLFKYYLSTYTARLSRPVSWVLVMTFLLLPNAPCCTFSLLALYVLAGSLGVWCKGLP